MYRCAFAALLRRFVRIRPQPWLNMDPEPERSPNWRPCNVPPPIGSVAYGIWRLEQAVAQLQEQVQQLQRPPPGPNTKRRRLA
jgi:hypothetical protein